MIKVANFCLCFKVIKFFIILKFIILEFTYLMEIKKTFEFCGQKATFDNIWEPKQRDGQFRVTKKAMNLPCAPLALVRLRSLVQGTSYSLLAVSRVCLFLSHLLLLLNLYVPGRDSAEAVAVGVEVWPNQSQKNQPLWAVFGCF